MISPILNTLNSKRFILPRLTYRKMKIQMKQRWIGFSSVKYAKLWWLNMSFVHSCMIICERIKRIFMFMRFNFVENLFSLFRQNHFFIKKENVWKWICFQLSWLEWRKVSSLRKRWNVEERNFKRGNYFLRNPWRISVQLVILCWLITTFSFNSNNIKPIKIMLRSPLLSSQSY